MMEKKDQHAAQKAWHAISVADVLREMDVEPEAGLSADDAVQRKEQYGPNTITQEKGTPAWKRFLLQFNQPLIYILLAATLITSLLHEWIDSAVIFAVVFVNAVIGFFQEAKALKALDALSRSMSSSVSVIRDGREQHIQSSELVSGDIVALSSGDKVSADMRLIYSRDVQINESSLTGESVPVQKQTEELDESTGLADRASMAYAATFVTYGRAKAVVVATGDQTEVGRISEMISKADDLETPLTIKIAQFSHMLLYVILALALVTFVIGIIRGQSVVDMFMAAIALCVGAIPEGLPAAVTITLAIGVSRMAQRKAIIRKLPAVETLGSTGIICSDKTGTLTENQMTVQRIFSGERLYTVSGVGYGAEGEITAETDTNEKEDEALKECLLAGLFCNDSRIVEKEGELSVEGDPTEGALLVSARKGEAFFPDGLPDLERKDSIPFESEYQYMATLHPGPEKSGRVYVKGSLERILSRSGDQLNGKGETVKIDRKAIEEQAEEMAHNGLRVLAFARFEIDAEKETIDHDDVPETMTFLGLQAMIDPPREEAIEAVKKCHAAGIAVKMITGDHLLTATAIAEELGLGEGPDVQRGELEALSGADIEKMNDDDLYEAVGRVSVFARVSPEEKLRLVKAIQKRGFVVAMTGDGVNDAPALRQANIGIAMGITGTEVAKEAADMVLTDDNFASIEAAVEEGRCVFDNLRKFIVWTLPTNLGEALAIITAVVLGLALPIAPVQILWINMTTALCLGMTLAMEPKEKDLMKRKPRDPDLPIITRDLLLRIVFVGVLLAIGVFSLFHLEKNNGLSISQAQTAAVAVLVFGELFYLFNCRSLKKNMLAVGLFSNLWLLGGVALMTALQVAFTYVPFMNTFFSSEALPLASWMRVLAIGLVIYIAVEIEKWITNRLVKDKK